MKRIESDCSSINLSKPVINNKNVNIVKNNNSKCQIEDKVKITGLSEPKYNVSNSDKREKDQQNNQPVRQIDTKNCVTQIATIPLCKEIPSNTIYKPKYSNNYSYNAYHKLPNYETSASVVKKEKFPIKNPSHILMLPDNNLENSRIYAASKNSENNAKMEVVNYLGINKLTGNENSSNSFEDMIEMNIPSEPIINDINSLFKKGNDIILNDKKISDSKELLIKETFDLIQLGIQNIKANDKEIVLVIGNTGSGKSTLVNYLTNKELYVYKNQNSFRKNLFLIGTKDDIECKIGHDPNKSETSIPNRMETSSTVYWDCPGFEDTRGFKHSIANQFYISRILDKAQKIKLLVTISDVELSATRGQILENLINRLNSMFSNDLDTLFNSITLVFTKVKGFSNVDDYKDDLKTQIIEADTDLDDSYKKILSSLIEKNRIALFNAPSKEGDIPKEDGKNILSVLESTDYTCKPRVQFTIDSNATDKLIDLMDYANEKAGIIIAKIKTSINNFINNSNLSNDKLESLYENLKLLKQKIIKDSDKDIINFIRKKIISNENIDCTGRLDELQQLSSQMFGYFFANFFPDGDKIRKDKLLSLLEIGFTIDKRCIENQYPVGELNNDINLKYEALKSIDRAENEFKKALSSLNNEYNKAEEELKDFLQETFKDKKLEAQDIYNLLNNKKWTGGGAIVGTVIGLILDLCLLGTTGGLGTVIFGALGSTLGGGLVGGGIVEGVRYGMHRYQNQNKK